MKYVVRNCFLFIILILLFHCADRKRANPIDPNNPETEGKPVGLNIYSKFDTIVLQWQKIDVKGLLGYKIYRKISDESFYTLIHSTSTDSTQFFDRNVIYDLNYSYKISAFSRTYESPLSDSVSIIPGPTIIWATDADNRRIIEITHDGLHEIQRIATDGYPWAIEVDSRDRSIWFSDVLYGFVYHIAGEVAESFVSPTRIWDPVDIELDEKRNVLWVADENGQVVRIAPNSRYNIKEIRHNDFKTPSSLAIDNHSGQCWLADPKAKYVFNIFKNGDRMERASTTFMKPMAVAIDLRDRSCWVADSNRIVRLLPNGDYYHSIEDHFCFAYSLDVNHQTGEIWVIDWGETYGEARIIKYDDQGNKLLQVTGFTRPTKIAVSRYDNSCIVVDTGSGKIIRVSSEGEILSKIGGYYYPRGIAIEYHQGN